MKKKIKRIKKYKGELSEKSNPPPRPQQWRNTIGSFGQHKSVEGNKKINVFITLDENLFKDF